MTNTDPQKSPYSSKNITKVTPREHIRRRPGMYMGGTDIKGLHQLVWASIDHMLEEAMLGLTTYIHIEIWDDNEIQINTNGTSLVDTSLNVEANAKALNELLTACKTRNPINDLYLGVYSDLLAIGLSIVNCLSQKFSVSIEHHANTWMHFYENGLPVDRLIHHALDESKVKQTRIRFKPDFDIMDANDFDVKTIASRLSDLSYLMPSVEFAITDMRSESEPIIYFNELGLANWVSKRVSIPAYEVIANEKTYDLLDKADELYKISVQFAFQFTDADTTTERSFVNTITTVDGGTHIEALHEAIVQALNNGEENLSWDTISQGFVGIIHILHPDPQFESRTKIKLLNPEVRDSIIDCVQEAFAENPTILHSLQARFDV